MRKVRLRDTEGNEVATCFFPEKAEEITLSKFIDLDVAYQKVVEVEEKIFSKDPPPPSVIADLQVSRLIALANCVAVICDADPNTIQKIPHGDLQGALAGFLRKEGVDKGQVENTLYTLFANIIQVVYKYKPKTDFREDYLFEHRGKKFRIKGSYRDVLTGQKRFHSMSVAQVIEGLEALKVYEANKKVDEKGNFLFTTILNIIACTALKEDESFPDEEAEIQRFLAKRIEFFKGVPMTVALDVYAFFLSTSKQAKGTRGADGFGTRRSGSQPRKRSKVTTVRKLLMRRFLPGQGTDLFTRG